MSEAMGRDEVIQAIRGFLGVMWGLGDKEEEGWEDDLETKPDLELEVMLVHLAGVYEQVRQGALAIAIMEGMYEWMCEGLAERARQEGREDLLKEGELSNKARRELSGAVGILTIKLWVGQRNEVRRRRVTLDQIREDEKVIKGRLEDGEWVLSQLWEGLEACVKERERREKPNLN